MSGSTQAQMGHEDPEEDTEKGYKAITLWVPQKLVRLRDRKYKCSSPVPRNFELEQAGGNCITRI